MSLPSPETMYRAIAEKDTSYVGVFFVAVKTTGIFCRPGCPARTPLEKNVEFFATAQQALLAGYRPCKRCRPIEAGDPPPDWLRPLLEEIERDPHRRLRDAELGRFGITPERARRYFKSKFGMTFQGYHRARRMGMAFKGIREGKDAVEAAMEQGYDSDSGFREAFAKVFGFSPSRVKNGAETALSPGGRGSVNGVNRGEGEVDAPHPVRPSPTSPSRGEGGLLTATWIETPLGSMIAAADDEALALLEFVDRRMLPTQIERMRRLFHCAVTPGTNAILQQTERELGAYFEGRLREFHTPLHLKGSEFQVRAWERLLRIPYGKTTSYGQMARDIGSPDAQRAVGKANGDNRIAILIPCHRVVRSDGTLCGYGGGLWRKKRLLELESGQRAL